MQVTELIQQIYYAYRGKGASKTPIFGSEKSDTALALANRKKNECNRDSDVTWTSNFNLVAPTEVGTVSTTGTATLTGSGTYFTDYAVGDKITVSGETERTIDTITSDTVLTVTVAFANTASAKSFTRQIIMTSAKTYSLNRKLYTPSDQVKITTSINSTDFSITSPNSRSTSDTYISGRNPKVITFYNDINTQLIGGVLTIPGYYLPDDMVLETDEVPVDDPNWLVYATAAELCRNDPAKEDQFANLIGMANELYRKMVSANNDNGYLTSVVPTNIRQISPSFEEDWSL